MPPDTARRDALARLLEDWEAGRMTPIVFVDEDGRENGSGQAELTPAGLAAARAAKGEAT